MKEAGGLRSAVAVAKVEVVELDQEHFVSRHPDSSLLNTAVFCTKYGWVYFKSKKNVVHTVLM